MRITGPASLQLSFTAATVTEFDATLLWLESAPLATRESRGIQSFTTDQPALSFVFAMDDQIVDIETTEPLA